MANKVIKSRWRFIDLLVDSKTGTLSSSKLWFNIGNAVLSMMFVHDGLIHELSDMKIFAYGAIVCASGMTSKFISKRAKYDSDNCGFNN